MNAAFEPVQRRRGQGHRQLPVLGILLLGVACTEETEDTATLLVSDPAAVLDVRLVQTEGDLPADNGPSTVFLKSDAGIVVGEASVSQGWVPMAWGEEDADPATDYLWVTVALLPDYVEVIGSVELHVEVGGSTTPWCEPLRPDGITDGVYGLKLQPACEQVDRLSGDCVIGASLTCEGFDGPCRKDSLTFQLWDDINTASNGACHEQVTE